MLSSLLLMAALLGSELEPRPDRQAVLLVVGAPGDPQYARQFAQWAAQWEEAANRADVELTQIRGDQPTADETTGESDFDRLRAALQRWNASDGEARWLVLIGHGTFDGRTAKFNLRGPDVAAEELAAWLEGCRRPLAIVNCASSSAPFINALSGENRVVITATKSGTQYNFARFGEYFAAAVADPNADLDKDRQTSLLEAFLMASSRVREFYESEGRLATEHALVDDNGDGRGTPATWFKGVRVTTQAAEGNSPDGLRANQFCLVRSTEEQQLSDEERMRRDELEAQLETLRHAKSKMGEDEYYQALEAILVPLAELYEE